MTFKIGDPHKNFKNLERVTVDMERLCGAKGVFLTGTIVGKTFAHVIDNYAVLFDNNEILPSESYPYSCASVPEGMIERSGGEATKVSVTTNGLFWGVVVGSIE